MQKLINRKILNSAKKWKKELNSAKNAKICKKKSKSAKSATIKSQECYKVLKCNKC